MQPLFSALSLREFDLSGPLGNPVPWVALILAGLGALILVEAMRIVFSGILPPPGKEPEALSAAT